MRSLFQFADLLDQRIDTLSNNLVIGLFLVCLVLGLGNNYYSLTDWNNSHRDFFLKMKLANLS